MDGDLAPLGAPDGRIDRTWSVVFVGDAWMAPYELTHVGGAIDFFHHNRTTGLAWLKRFRDRCPDSVWLNPEPRRIWNAPSIRIISSSMTGRAGVQAAIARPSMMMVRVR